MGQSLNSSAGPEGTVLGTPASGPVAPPAPLPPVAFRPRSLAEVEAGVPRIRLGAEQLLNELAEQGVTAPPPEQERRVRWVAWRVQDAGGDPAGYVRYVVEQFRTRRKRRPMWQQVLGEKAVEGWLPEYTREQRQAADRVAYEATPERRTQYAERMKQDLLP